MKVLVVFFFTMLPSIAFGITVDEAYNAIPHERVEYKAEESTIGVAEREFLTKFFQLSDRALVLRIEAMRGMNSGLSETYEKYRAGADTVFADLENLAEPDTAKGFRALLIEAVESQGAFFKRWHEAQAVSKPFSFPGGETTGVDRDISRASEKLRRLYSELMGRFPGESPRNKNAFYQHLCALDFL